jgi:hypothetical protein
MRSFDLFDTLLGRLHCSPISVFDLVEKNYPYPCFALYRMVAANKSDGTLPDIYRQMQKMIDLTDDQAKSLMAFEFETELSQVFPILENLNQVSDGDLIISDTYYDTAQIKKILEKIGLKKEVHIYATPRGKATGSIWPVVKEKHTISYHIGDNFGSDFASPIKNGVVAHCYEKSGVTDNEYAMYSFGQSQLFCLMRTLRLLNPHPTGGPEHVLWNEQAGLNVPILVHASHYLNEFCKKHGKKRVLFTSRDCCLWIEIFKTLYPEYESIYFHASRNSYYLPQASYIEYVKNIYTDDSVIVDGFGSGKSCRKFFKENLGKTPLYLSIFNNKKYNHAILRAQRAVGLEKLNYDKIGTLVTVRNNEAIRSPVEYSLKYVDVMHACIEKCTELMPLYNLGSFEVKVMKWARKRLTFPLLVEVFIDHTTFHPCIIDGEVKYVYLT